MTDPLTHLIGEPEDAPRVRPRKSAEAYRTISEVADDLHVPQHVLRFWETKFPRIKPLKRGGGRRYYRPDDVGLLRRIADLLYIQGYTIKGVQRLLKDGGGALNEEIPPASAEERAAAEAERVMAGVSTSPRARATPEPQLTIGLAEPQVQTHKPAPSVQSPGPNPVNLRLVETLRVTLTELERLRASLL